MKKKKGNKQDVLISAFIIVVVIIGFIGGFVLASDLKDRLFYATDKKTDSESSNIAVAGKTGNKVYGFDEKFVESNSGLDYKVNFGTFAGSTDAYFTINYGDTKKDLTITRYSYDTEGSQEFTMSFVANVVDVYAGQFNNDPQYNAIFYLLDNGDICYSYIEEMVQNNAYGSFNYVDGLSNIVKFYVGSSCDYNTETCKSTTFAQDVDGTIYDLVNYIR